MSVPPPEFGRPSKQSHQATSGRRTDPSARKQVADSSGHGEGYFLQVLQAIPTAVYTTDAKGRITFFNEAAAALWGRRPRLGDDWWCGSWRLFWPDGRPMEHGECPMAVTLKTGEPVQGLEAIAERPDGSRFPFMPYPTLLRDAKGNVIGAVNLLVDISDRKRIAETAQRMAAVVESSEDAIVVKNLQSTVLSWNRGAERLFGYTAMEIVGKSITTIIPKERSGEEGIILGRILRGERIEHFETVRRRKDGSLVDISLSVSPVRNERGEIVGASKIARDISERKRADERQALLLGEMKHRAGNLAAIINAIANQSRPENEPVVDHFIEVFMGRLRAILAVGELALSSSTRTPDLSDVIRSALKPFDGWQGSARIVVSGPSLNIPERLAGGLALAIHELATNAIKHGSLSGESGSVSISWTVTPQQNSDRVQLKWRECDGPTVHAPARQGFGTRVITSALSGAKNGKVKSEFAPDGFRCCFEFDSSPKAV